MSGIQMGFMGFGGSGLRANPAFAANLVNVSINAGTRQASLTFVTDGTTTPAGGSSTANNWYTPTTASIGTSFWVKCTASGTNFTFGGTSANTWVQISSNQTVTVSNSPSTSEGSGTIVVNFSIDGGGTTSDSFNVGFDVGYSP